MRSLTICIALITSVFWIESGAFGLPADSVAGISRPKKCKTGWKPIALPVLGYNTDIGFQYGLCGEITDYGDSCFAFPKYLHSFYVEASFTTKGGNIFQFFYDSDKLLKGLRVTADVSYLTEKALDFYGFNGYKSVYNPSWEDDQDSDYVSRVFYRHERKFFKLALGLQGRFFTPHLRWFAGVTILDIRVDSVNVEKLNKGQKEEKKLPYVPGLYDHYVSWGILDAKEKNGGMNNFVKLGLIFDTRDVETNPTRGLWSEINFVLAPKFIGDGNYGFIKLALIHRQYINLIRKRLIFAYRLAYQGTIAGTAPFYIQPIMINSWEKTTTVDGLGGSRNIRGIVRNRVVGDGIIYGTAELRWKIVNFQLFKQRLYLGANAYADAGMVVQEIPVNKEGIPSNINQDDYFSASPEVPHTAVGGGIKLSYNENFVLTCDFGWAPDKRDGSYGVYVGFGYLF